MHNEWTSFFSWWLCGGERDIDRSNTFFAGRGIFMRWKKGKLQHLQFHFYDYYQWRLQICFLMAFLLRSFALGMLTHRQSSFLRFYFRVFTQKFWLFCNKKQFYYAPVCLEFQVFTFPPRKKLFFPYWTHYYYVCRQFLCQRVAHLNFIGKSEMRWDDYLPNCFAFRASNIIHMSNKTRAAGGRWWNESSSFFQGKTASCNDHLLSFILLWGFMQRCRTPFSAK